MAPALKVEAGRIGVLLPAGPWIISLTSKYPTCVPSAASRMGGVSKPQ